MTQILDLGRVVGYSAYELAVQEGYTGTLEEWLEENNYTALDNSINISQGLGAKTINVKLDNTTRGNVRFEVTSNGIRAFVDDLSKTNMQVDVLPAEGSGDFIYLIATGEPDEYTKWIWVEFIDGTFGWLNIGTTAVNPDDFATKVELNELVTRVTELKVGTENLLDNSNDLIPTIQYAGSGGTGSIISSKISEFGFDDANQVVFSLDNYAGPAEIYSGVQFNLFNPFENENRLTTLWGYTAWFKNTSDVNLSIGSNRGNPNKIILPGQSTLINFNSDDGKGSSSVILLAVSGEKALELNKDYSFVWARIMLVDGNKVGSYALSTKDKLLEINNIINLQNVYLTLEEYNLLKDSGELKDDVTYNIWED